MPVIEKRDWAEICRQCAKAILSGEFTKKDFAHAKKVPQQRLYREMSERGYND